MSDFHVRTYLGIDVSPRGKPFTFVALSEDLRLRAVGEGSAADVLAFAAGQSEACAAVNAPAHLNQQLMRQSEIRHQFTPPPPPRLSNLRAGEYVLMLHDLHCAHTPADLNDCPPWMRRGLEIYTNLTQLGYAPHPQTGAPRVWLESHAEAAYCALLNGVVPFAAESLEGRLQRQLALAENGMSVPDPMDFFEEITRHKLLRGILPIKDVFSPGELNALVLALTAWTAQQAPQQIGKVGDETEGFIYLPKPLPERTHLQEPLFANRFAHPAED